MSWNLIFLLLQNVFLKIGLLTDNIEYFSLSPLLKDGFCKAIDVKGMLKAFCQSLFFLHSRPFVGGLWFLGGLFYSTLFYVLQEFIFKKMKIEKFHFLFSIVYICLTYFLVKSSVIQKIPFGKQLCMIFLAESMLTVGALIRKYNVMEELKKKNKYLGFFFSLGILILLSQYGSVSFASASIVNPFFFITVSILGFVQMFYFSLIIKEIKFFSLFLASTGIHTITILALHTLLFKFITLIQVAIYNKPQIYLALYPVYKNTLLWSSVYVLVGFGVSYVIALILSKNSVCKYLLKP